MFELQSSSMKWTIREEIDDAGIASILAKQVKMRKDALADFESAGRTDLIDAYNAEIEVLMDYMPKQLTADEITGYSQAELQQEMEIEQGSGKSFHGKTHGCRDA